LLDGRWQAAPEAAARPAEAAASGG